MSRKRSLKRWSTALISLTFASLVVACNPIQPVTSEGTGVTAGGTASESALPPLATATEYYNRGLTSAGDNKFEQAIADFTSALEIDPKLAAAYLNRGLAYAALDKHEVAITDYDRAIELTPYMPLVYTARAQSQLALGDTEQALADLNR